MEEIQTKVNEINKLKNLMKKMEDENQTLITLTNEKDVEISSNVFIHHLTLFNHLIYHRTPKRE